MYKNKDNTLFNIKKKSVVSEAEYVINNYIKENELTLTRKLVYIESVTGEVISYSSVIFNCAL